MNPQQRHEDDHLELGLIKDELRCLERRLTALEHAALEHRAPKLAEPPVPAGLDFTLPSAPNAIPALGRAVLGLAGAFLLRALAEAGAMPILLVVMAAILYAVAWLVFSVRTRQQDTFGSTLYGITAALILAPLLWEATVRFQVLPPPATAGILVVFLVLSSALAWSRTSGAVITVTTLATLLTALVLMVQTGDLVPFAAAILAIAGVIEASARYGHARNMQIPAAIAADFAIFLVYFVMTRPSGVPEHYKPVSVIACLLLGVLLLLIYAVSLVWQSVALGRPIGIACIVQVTAAFGLAAGGALVIEGAKAAGPVGVLCVLFCAACYFTAFKRFGHSECRDHHVFASWAAALALLACALIFPATGLTLIWSAASVLTMMLGVRASQVTLRIHSTLFLLAAGLIARFPERILNAFTGDTPGAANSALWMLAVSASLCYGASVFGKSGPVTLNAALALITACSIGTLVILEVASFAGKPTPSFLATARTLVICTLAAAFGFIGGRTRHRELLWVSYAAIALGTVKLLMEDFQQSHAAALAASLVCYGAVLILVPKLSSLANK